MHSHTLWIMNECALYMQMRAWRVSGGAGSVRHAGGLVKIT